MNKQCILSKAICSYGSKELAVAKAQYKKSNPQDDLKAIRAKLNEKVVEIEALLRTFFEMKWNLPPGSLNKPFEPYGKSANIAKKETPNAFKWSYLRDFETSLFEVYFLPAEKEVAGKKAPDKKASVIKKDGQDFSAVSAYPPPPKPKVIGYTAG